MSQLAGRRVVVTRAAEQAAELLDRLRAAGAEPLALPTIAFAPPADSAPLDAALREWARFDACLFTSANAVRAAFARASALGLAMPPPRGWVCAIGPATAAALADYPGWTPGILPAEASAEGVLEALAAYELHGCRIFFPRAALGRAVIPGALAARGAHLTRVTAYRTLLAENSRPAALALFPGVDAVVFASPSAARNLAALLGPEHAARLRGAAVAVIGTATRGAVEALGWTVAAVAARPSAQALVAALAEYWCA
ncbi:MAG: uroporphyrinogen-III synthase [Terriglobales bacterium]